MSTDINIKKRITILEESAILTKDVNSIDFVGTGVVSSAIGDDVTVTINGGVGAITYFLNESVTQAPYKEFSSIVTGAVEQLVPLTVAGGVTSVIAEFQTPTGVPGTTQIVAGLWAFYLHFNAGSAGQNWIIRPTVLKRDLGGIETLLFTPDPVIVTSMNVTTEMYTSDGVFPSTTLLTTDRIVVRISMQNTTGVSQTVNFRTEGSQHYSVATTTLNPTYNPSAVLSVTGTAPVVSSGGTTPAISIPQADALIDGYLSSSDFAVFNAKVGGSGTTNYLSKFTGTGTIGNSLIFDNGTNVGIGTITPTEKLDVTGNTKLNGTLSINDVSSTLNVVGNAFGQASLISPTGAIVLTPGLYGVQINGANPDLQVNGKTTTSTFQLTTAPTAGYVLKSDASGNGSWGTIAAAAGLIYITNQTTGVVTYYTTLELARDGSVSGDTIYVNPGTYVVTTTATNGIAKSGVNWYFEPGAIVNKTSAGNMFYDTGFALPCNVYGFGTFNKTTSAGYIYYNTKINSVFEAISVTSSISHCFFTDIGEIRFKVDYATSTAGTVLFMNQSNGSVGNRIKIDCIYWKSTANSVIGGNWWYHTRLLINGNKLESTTTTTISSYNSGNNIEINVAEIIGLTYGLTSGDGGSGIINVNCTYISGISDLGKEYNIFGHCGILNSGGGYYNVLRTQTITVSSGYVKTSQNMYDASSALVTVSGGVLDIEFGLMSYGIIFNCTGGIMNIRSAVVAGQISSYQGRVINGGEVNVYSKFIHGGGADYPSYNIFTLQAGTLRLLAPIQNNFNVGSSNFSAHGIVWSGGKLIIDRCAINIADTIALPIQATTAGLNLKVLSGGLSTNITADGGVLPGKKMKYKFSISAIAATGINILIPTSYNISESNTGVYNTKALLAQRMAALINGSPFLNVAVIATQDIPGTDEYFYIETLTAGPTFSYNTPVNFSAITIQRWNSYAITNITGGSILENSNVE